jgi:D-alanyl-lipoteichoic acid acyltransferase DltB (MBOAT superfamily)
LSVSSPEFLIALFAGSAMFATLRGLWLRRMFLTVCSGLFLWVLLPDGTHVVTLVAFVLSGYLAARLLAWRPSTALLATYLAALTLAFVLLKRYAFLQLLPGSTLLEYSVDIVGLSFIFFRQIHYVVDAKQGEIAGFTLWGYLCYQLNLFTLLAGPIQRYQRFHEDWQSLVPRHADTHELRMAFLRILLGVIKVSFLGEACLWLAFHQPGIPAGWEGIARFYLYPAYVYFNFAGYCDIVITGASLAGLRVPENFQWPYLARDMIDFWTRWHRSLSFWIRDYIFTPTYMAIARRWPARASNLAFLCFFLAMFLAGVWHGASWNFAVFGVLNGIGVSAAKVWETWIVARRGRKGLRTYLTSRPILIAARVANFHFVCLTMIFLRPESTHTLFSWLGRAVQA